MKKEFNLPLLCLGVLSLILCLVCNFVYPDLNVVVLVIGYVLSALIICLSILTLFIEIKLDLNIKKISLISIMGAISVILYVFIKFPLPIFPTFLEIHISELPAMIVSFAYGPISGTLVVLIRFILKLLFGSSTFGVGELADLAIGLTLVIISGLIYKKNRSLKGAFISILCGMVGALIVTCLLNYLVLIPFYVELMFKGSYEPLLKMCSMIPNINKENFMISYIFLGVIPFNLFRFIIVFIFTFILYKRIHKLIKN